MQVRYITNTTKEYPEMIRVTIYKEPLVLPITAGSIKRKRELVDGEYYEPTVTSLNRTKTLIRDIVLCNDFDLFCTFTFDPDKVDRFSLMNCWHKLDRWLNHQRERSNYELRYLIVPEQHKNGAWHFHALISHFNGILRDSGHKSGSGRPIYNITSYRSGFSTAVPIDSREAVANYVTKYITKDFVKTFNQRRFFCSRNLLRPVKTTNSPIFKNTLPLFRKKVHDGRYTEIYDLLPPF